MANIFPTKRGHHEANHDINNASTFSFDVAARNGTQMIDQWKKVKRTHEMENSRLEDAPFFCETQFAILPDELLVEIFRYLSISDLWNFCYAFKEYGHLLEEKVLTRNIDLNGLYDMDRILLDINPENVTCLNLNYCHWLLQKDLLSFVGKCSNLETLLALGTKLELGDRDINIYHKTKINKLAVTINNKIFGRTAVLGLVTNLALEIDGYVRDVCPPEEFYRIFPSLQRLWVDRISSCVEWMCEWLERYKSSGQLQELVYYCAANCNIFHHCDLITTATNLCLRYIGRKANDKRVAYFERMNNPTVPLLSVENVQSAKPYGLKVAKLLNSGAKTLETVQFKELNFYQSHYYNNKCSNKAFQQLLMSSNARNIEKLTLCICFLDDYKHDQNAGNDSCVLKNFNNLRYLQFCCKRSPKLRDLQEYNSIANLTKLRYLFVEIPENNDGDFLCDILNKCHHLETLRIDNMHNSGNDPKIINRNIYKALEYSTNLKNLLLTHFDFLDIDELLSLLIKSKKMKLQKLLLSCEYTTEPFEAIYSEFLRLYGITAQNNVTEYCNCKVQKYLKSKQNLDCLFSLDLLSEYLLSNPQLTDCQLYITMIMDEQMDLIRRQVSTFNRSYIYFDVARTQQNLNKNYYLSDCLLREDIGAF